MYVKFQDVKLQELSVAKLWYTSAVLTSNNADLIFGRAPPQCSSKVDV